MPTTKMQPLSIAQDHPTMHRTLVPRKHQYTSELNELKSPFDKGDKMMSKCYVIAFIFLSFKSRVFNIEKTA